MGSGQVVTSEKVATCGIFRRLADSNRRTRLCRPLPNHSAKAPGRGMVSAPQGTPFRGGCGLPSRSADAFDTGRGCTGLPRLPLARERDTTRRAEYAAFLEDLRV